MEELCISTTVMQELKSGFGDNYGYYGGAFYGHRGIIDIISSTFSLNRVESYGGAMYFYYSNARVEGCLLRNNNSATRGGALYTFGGTVNISSSTFSLNPLKN